MTRRVFIDMDGVLCDIKAAIANQAKKPAYCPYPQAMPGFFATMEPMPQAISSLNVLRSDPRYDCWILTAPSVMNPLCYTEKRLWIEDNFDIELAHKLIISPDKSLLKGDILIDDCARGRGQESFEGTFILFGSSSYPDWSAVLLDLI